MRDLRKNQETLISGQNIPVKKVCDRAIPKKQKTICLASPLQNGNKRSHRWIFHNT